jgi:carboxyl-terminal processing protease
MTLKKPACRLAVALLALAIVMAPVARAGDACKDSKDSEEDYGPLPKFDDAAETFRMVKQELLDGYYRDDVTEADLYRAAVQGMLANVDPALKPYNRLLSPVEYGELQIDLKGQVVGIGVMLKLESDTGLALVLGVLPGSPAERSGLREGDRILSVDGKSLKGLKLVDIVQILRGREGESVSLSVLHDAQVSSKTIRRERVVWDSVHHQRFPGDIEVLSIGEFSERTPEALRRALKDVASSPPKGLVIDLRGNHGGLLEQALDAAKLLLPHGSPIAQLVRRGKNVEQRIADAEPLLQPLPTVVLVNGNTMSSAELVAAALREGLHAPVIGSKTKGKWSVQELKELPNHFVLKYTVAVFRSPGGQSYEGTGLPPDVEVAMDDDALEKAEHLHEPAERLAADVQLRSAVNLLRMRP